MKRDIIGDIFLGGVLLSLLFLFTFPAYFCFSANVPREISLNERLMSVFFVMAFILTCIWFCWKKKVWVMAGVATFGLLAYIPKWFLPKVNLRIIMNGKNLLDSFLSMILNRIYELTHAPFTGLLGMVPEKTVEKLPYMMFPVVVISYILSQIVRFYYNAYVTEKKQMYDFDHFRKTNDIRKPAFADTLEKEEPSPLGTVVMNEKAEIAKESFPIKSDMEQTQQHNLSSEPAPAAIPGGADATAVIPLAAVAPTSKPADETQVIALAAQAPTSKPAEETQVIPLAAQAPTSKPAEETQVIPLAAHAPTSKPAEETQVIPLAAHAPSSEPNEEQEEEKKPEELDFPDVHGEAEKIDVFGDSDLD